MDLLGVICVLAISSKAMLAIAFISVSVVDAYVDLHFKEQRIAVPSAATPSQARRVVVLDINLP